MNEIKEILTTLELMAETENLIAELYKTCGETWKENEEFWFSISNDEKRHSEYIKKIADIIEKKPENFQKYRPFNPTVVKTGLSLIFRIAQSTVACIGWIAKNLKKKS